MKVCFLNWKKIFPPKKNFWFSYSRWAKKKNKQESRYFFYAAPIHVWGCAEWIFEQRVRYLPTHLFFGSCSKKSNISCASRTHFCSRNSIWKKEGKNVNGSKLLERWNRGGKKRSIIIIWLLKRSKLHRVNNIYLQNNKRITQSDYFVSSKVFFSSHPFFHFIRSCGQPRTNHIAPFPVRPLLLERLNWILWYSCCSTSIAAW